MMCRRCAKGMALVPVSEGSEKSKLCIDCTSEWQSNRPNKEKPVPQVFLRFLDGEEVGGQG